MPKREATKRTSKIRTKSRLSHRVANPPRVTARNDEATPSPYIGRKRKKIAVVAIALLGAGAALFIAKNLLFAAFVNGEPITRLSVLQELEKRQGKEVLDGLIARKLIVQESRKRDFSVSQQETDEGLKQIEANLSVQGQKLEDVLALQGLSRQDLIDQLVLQTLIEKMLASQSAVSEAEVDTFLSTSAKDKNDQAVRAEARRQLTQEKIGASFPAWIEELRAKASISYLVNYQ